jgi:hypothetical protein
MRMSHMLVVSLLGLPLGGCLGVTLPPQPLPDWAMNPQAQYQEQRADRATGVPRKKQRIARQHVPGELSAAQSALLIGESDAQPVARAVETKPFAPGWDAREDERDPSLRRTLNICRGC